jgi:hypothetical protein
MILRFKNWMNKLIKRRKKLSAIEELHAKITSEKQMLMSHVKELINKETKNRIKQTLTVEKRIKDWTLEVWEHQNNVQTKFREDFEELFRAFDNKLTLLEKSLKKISSLEEMNKKIENILTKFSEYEDNIEMVNKLSETIEKDYNNYLKKLENKVNYYGKKSQQMTEINAFITRLASLEGRITLVECGNKLVNNDSKEGV